MGGSQRLAAVGCEPEVMEHARDRAGRGSASAAGEVGSLQVSAESPGGGPRGNEGRCYKEDGRDMAMVRLLWTGRRSSPAFLGAGAPKTTCPRTRANADRQHTRKSGTHKFQGRCRRFVDGLRATGDRKFHSGHQHFVDKPSTKRGKPGHPSGPWTVVLMVAVALIMRE